MNDFFNHTFHLVEQAVDVYLKRGFTSLTVSFGCTGGQHRSVYMAERLAANIKGRHKLNIIVNHQELDKPYRMSKSMCKSDVPEKGDKLILPVKNVVPGLKKKNTCVNLR